MLLRLHGILSQRSSTNTSGPRCEWQLAQTLEPWLLRLVDRALKLRMTLGSSSPVEAGKSIEVAGRSAEEPALTVGAAAIARAAESPERASAVTSKVTLRKIARTLRNSRKVARERNGPELAVAPQEGWLGPLHDGQTAYRWIL